VSSLRQGSRSISLRQSVRALSNVLRGIDEELRELIRTTGNAVGGPNGAHGPPRHETQHAAIEMKKLGIAPSSLRCAALNARELPSRTSVSGDWFLRTLVRQPTAGCVRAGGIDGYAPFF
jgi:hypothetical protein